jgi:polyisoprenoid-binding protein YceI
MSKTALEQIGGVPVVGTWRLDPSASLVEFRGKHLWRLLTVTGHFGGLEGSATIGADGSAAGTLVVDATTLDTGNAKRDDGLKDKEFFDANEYGAITFECTGVAAEADGTLSVGGRLTVRGQTRDVKLVVSVREAVAQRVVLTTDVVIDRAEFGMGKNPLGMAPTRTPIHVEACFVKS